jgi:predicted permease
VNQMLPKFVLPRNMDWLLQDVKFGIRQLRKSPVFTAAAILTLALGIGANATVFTWFNAIVINPLPGVARSHDLVTVRWHTPMGSVVGISWLDYLDYRNRNHTLQEFAVSMMVPLSLGEGTQPERVWSMVASSNYFNTLGVKPELGRTFLPDEDQNAGGHPVVVLSHHFWQNRFGGDPKIIGQQILLNKRSFTVAGVTPEGFGGSVVGLSFEMFVPMTMADVLSNNSFGLENRGVTWYAWFHARPKPGVTQRAVIADFDAISAQLTHEFQHTDSFNRTDVLPISQDGGGSILIPVAILLMSVVAVVLLIACANVANLLLARASGRRREIAIRLALGVGRGQLIRQLLIENLMLAIGGLAAAMAVLPITMQSIMRFAPASDLPVGLTLRADTGVQLFTVGIALVATLLFGMVPALRASRPDVVVALKDDSGASASPRRAWLRNSLVVSQVALSLVLLISAGLFLKTLYRASSINPGFDPRNVLLVGIDLVPNGYDAARGEVAIRQMTVNLGALPGAVAVSTVRSVPLGLTGSSASRIEAEGYIPAKDEIPRTNTNIMGIDYFRTVNTLVVEGREFNLADTTTSQQVAVVNQTFARRFLPRGAVGRRIQVNGEWRVVVGVVRDSKFYSVDEKPRPWTYLPLAQSFASESNFVVRTAGDPMRYARAVETAIHQVDPALPVYAVRPFETAISASYFGQRMGGSFLGLFGVIALALAAIGLYGVLAYTVSQRSREVGIRVALGASRGNVLGLILGQGARLVAAGLVIGLAISFAVTRLMRALLMDVSPTDVPVIAGVSALLAFVALLAILLPAYRATQIDPILATRHQ